MAQREKLTHADMVSVIESGGSVLYDGQIISKVSDLPTEGQLAKGNPQAESAALNNIDTQIAALSVQRAGLVSAAAAAPAPKAAPTPELSAVDGGGDKSDWKAKDK